MLQKTILIKKSIFYINIAFSIKTNLEKHKKTWKNPPKTQIDSEVSCKMENQSIQTCS